MQKYHYNLKCANYNLNGGEVSTLKQCIRDMIDTIQLKINDDLEELKRIHGMTFEIWKDKKIIKMGEYKDGKFL